ncbi:Xenin [Dactylellina cionopaga]|nr:Xenin [Dactylellina cionopaga]
MSISVPMIRARNANADAPDDVDRPQNDVRATQNESEATEAVTVEPSFVSAKSQTSSRPTLRPTLQTSDLDSKSISRQTSDSINSPSSVAHSPRPRDQPFDEIAIDPLSQHILKRTGTSSNLHARLKRQDTSDSTHGSLGEDSTSSFKASGASTPPVQRVNLPSLPIGKDKKKGVSFLSRFIGGSKRKEPTVNEEDDTESVIGDQRTEGLDAAVFSQPIGFTPKFPPPPKYIRVRAHHKPIKDFNRVFLAQELYKNPNPIKDARNVSPGENGSTPSLPSLPSLPMAKHKSGAIWSLKFSKDGRYLAVAGQDKIVTVWEVLSSEEDRREHEIDEDSQEFSNGHNLYSNGGVRLNAPVFRAEPLREYTGHTADILDLSWSKNNFLLSSSMDKTVRLWHVSRAECLCAFQHSDFVTSILFHPKDDRFFLAGSLDSKLRLWSIPDKSVAFSVELPDLITAVAFTPDGKYAIAGCLSGLCIFYETEGLRYHTQVHVRSSHGRNARGSKITGIEALQFPPDDPNGEIKLLITSNDSRVRMYNFRDKSLEIKFRGNENTCSQIHATFSDDMKYVICGSEDRKVYIWDVNAGLGEKKTKVPLEYFEAHSSIVTCAIIAPAKTRQLLGHSGDPIYDLCNPPPVTLISRSESFASSIKFSEALPKGRDHTAYPNEKINNSKPKQAEESPAYITRSLHLDGNIMVTADYNGKIKVFRQDCAYLKRRNESWETSSTFSKKIGTGIFGSGGNKRSSGHYQSPTGERILSWRNSVQSQASQDSSAKARRGSMGGRDSAGRDSAGRDSAGRDSAGRDSAGQDSVDDKDTSIVSSRNRSLSPKKSISTMSTQSYGTASSNMPKIAITDVSGNGPVSTRSRATSVNSVASSNLGIRGKQHGHGRDHLLPSSPLAKTMSNDPADLLLQESGQSLAFYNLAAAPSTSIGHLMADGSDRRTSIISSMDTDEGFSSESDNDDALRCKR